MPLKLNAFSGGSVTLNPASTASDFTHTLPAVSGTVVTTGSSAVVTQAMLASNVTTTGPAFSSSGSGQTIPNSTFTKVTLATEAFDTANAFDTSISRFTPLVAGYYQFNFTFCTNQNTASLFGEIRKNTSRISIGTIATAVSGIGAVSCGSALVYLNGSTDYIELFGYQNTGGSVSTFIETNLSGFLARAA